MILYKFKLKTTFNICLVGFLTILCLFYKDINDDNASNE
jgi:hypothetical protein